MKAYNATDEGQQRSVVLESIGEATLDIFERLDNTGTDLDGAITALRNKLKESQNRLFNIHKCRRTKQSKDVTWDSFIAKPRAEDEHCDFSVRQKMEEEIQNLIDQDIIGKVNDPTGWG